MTEGDGDAAGRLGLRIALLRVKAGWTQPQLGVRAGLSKATINKLERGVTKNPGVATLARVAAALGWPDYVLMLESDALEPPAPNANGLPRRAAAAGDLQSPRAEQAEEFAELRRLVVEARDETTALLRTVRALLERNRQGEPAQRGLAT